MHHTDNFHPPFRLNHWLVQPDLNRITGPDGATGIEPRVMKVLLVLATRPGDVVHRNDLLDEVWGDTVVGEETLTRAISELRRVFGDRARNPEYIETIRQHGYRLIAPVTPAEDDEVADTPPPPAEPAPVFDPPPGPSGTGRARGIPRSVYLAVGALVLLAIVFGPRLFRRADDTPVFEPPAPRALQAIPLTSFPGQELHPALSPDGSRVAFVWAGPQGDNADLYVKQRNSETPLRLTEDPGWVAWPAWAPDGQTLAFVRGTDTGSALCLIPSLGGAVREIHQEVGFIEGLDWSPDGKTLAFSAPGEERFSHLLWFLSLDDFAVNQPPMEGYAHTGMFQPRFSPDGSEVAWIGLGPAGRSHLMVAAVDGSGFRSVLKSFAPIQGLAWTPDGRFLIYGSSPNDRFTLWRVSLEGGEPQWIPTPGDFALNPTIAMGTGDLAYEQVRMDRDIWRVRIHGRDPWQLETAPFLTSTRMESEADFHPDGDRVVFVSSRSGYAELWVGGADGANPRQVTTLRAGSLNQPRWAPGGDRIAFNAVVGGESRPMIVQALGGPAREVVPGETGLVFTAWAADGGALLVGADRGTGWEIHRWPIGGGDPVTLTREGGLTAAEDRSGRALYYTRPMAPGLWKTDLENGFPAGEPELILPDLGPADARHWRLRGGAAGATGIFYVSRMGGEAFLTLYETADKTSFFLTDLPNLAPSGLALSPDGDTILYARTENQAGDLMLIEDFSP